LEDVVVDSSSIPLCECGCGEPVSVYTKNNTRDGAVKGEYRRFISRHQYRSFNNAPEKLWERTEADANGCWLWTGACFENGYGTMKVANKQWRTHRLAWTLTYGAIPQELSVLHKCDVRRCCNPKHLFLGTTADNHADRNAKGRQAKGERMGAAKLTEGDVRLIRRLRAEGYPRVGLADRFGVTENTIYRIVVRKSWTYLD
jgi:hypothetical protein